MTSLNVQLITSCNKSVMTRVLTLLELIFSENLSTLKAIKSHFEGYMLKKNLHKWSFHIYETRRRLVS